MKMVPFYALLGLAGTYLGARYLADAAALAFPDAGGHGAWYASRAAGIGSYLMLWLSTIAGVLMSSAWFDGLVNRGRLLAIHQTAAFAGLLLGVGHALVLIPDEWTRFGLVDLFLPFGSYYKTVLTGLGTVTLYLFALVTLSFWLRNAIGAKMWRVIHVTSFIALAGVFWHGVAIGTDSGESWVVGLYLATSTLLVAAVGVRVTYQRPVRRPQKEAVPAG